MKKRSSVHFDKMTQDEMNQTTGSGACFILGAGGSSGEVTSCFLAGSTWGGGLKCIIVGSYN